MEKSPASIRWHCNTNRTRKKSGWIFYTARFMPAWNLSPENARYLRLEPDRYKLHEQLQPAAILLLFNLKYSLFSDRLTRLALGQYAGHSRTY